MVSSVCRQGKFSVERLSSGISLIAVELEYAIGTTDEGQ